MPRAKLITKNYLEKQVVKYLPIEVHGLVEPHLDLIICLLDVLNSDMLMVRPNQNFQWRCHMPAEEMSGAKLNARNCLVK